MGNKLYYVDTSLRPGVLDCKYGALEYDGEECNLQPVDIHNSRKAQITVTTWNDIVC